MKTKWKLWMGLTFAMGIALVLCYGFFQSPPKELRLMTSGEDLKFVEGVKPDFNQLTFEVTYENGKKMTLRGGQLTYSEVVWQTTGEQRIVGTYKNLEIPFSIWIREKELESIEIVAPPDRLSYIQGQSIELSGIQAKGQYDNGTVEDIPFESLSVEDFDKEQVGTLEISVSVEGLTDTITVEYKAKTFLELVLLAPPQRLVYPEKVELDVTGLQVEARYDNGIPERVDPALLQVTGYEKTRIGTQTVTLSYKGKSVQFAVEVEPRKETGIVLLTKPQKILYEYNEPFQEQGLTVALRYNNGEQEALPLQDVSFSGYTAQKAGTQNVVVRFKTHQSQFEVTVKPFIVSNGDALDVVVNKNRMLPTGFTPSGLVKVGVPVVYASSESNQMKNAAAAALYELVSAGHEEGVELLARSGYRSYNTQKTLYNNSVKNNGLAHANRYTAQPGHSEHQTGWAMDMTAASVNNGLVTSFGSTKEGIWLAGNAHRFGFIIRYPKGKEAITGYAYEPWHIRYVGIEAAAFIYQRGITLEEYYGVK